MDKSEEIYEQIRDIKPLTAITPQGYGEIVQKLHANWRNKSPITLQVLAEAFIPFVNPIELDMVVSVISTCCETIRHKQLTLTELEQEIAYIVDSFEEPDSGWSESDKQAWRNISKHFFEILELPFVQCVAKANMLSYDHANLLHRAGLITDVRPVFDKEADDIWGFVITHTLRIQYWALDNYHELSLAVDEKDILELKHLCERALKKAEKAHQVIERDVGKPIIRTGADGE